MLKDWQSTSAVRGAPDFFVEHLQLLLVDDRGKQLRGRVEHGLLSADHSDDHTIGSGWKQQNGRDCSHFRP